MSAVLQVLGVLTTAIYSTYGGGCTFPASWSGGWFQSGYPSLIAINSSHIYSKGECSDADGYDKFLLYDRSDDCYRCMVIHEKHKYVLQYKETYCSPKDSLASICESISGDAPLYSMFRKEPRPEPQQCPFHPAPFTFTYSRGSGDCANPPSRAEACTDDSRLLLRYMACPDVPGTESNVEELVCLATWKEGSTRYLVGQISQVNRRNTIASDEDTYRCFIYKGQHGEKSMTYNIAQSGDATCNGLSSPTDGSRTMKLTNSDDEHTRCHFPSWIVEHHKWYSLDRTHQYHFTTKNATLKVMNTDGTTDEKRLVCHSILEHKDKKYIKLVAHVTRGCESGHQCVWVWRRSGALELRGGGALWEAPHDACHHPPPKDSTTLVSTNLTPMRCPLVGRYTVQSAPSRRRRDHGIQDDLSEQSAAECDSSEYMSAEVGCGPNQDTIDFKSACSSTVYTCYGAWETGGGGGYVVVGVGAVGVGAGGRGAHHPRTLCIHYTHHYANESSPSSSSPSSASSPWVSVRSSAWCGRGAPQDRVYNLTANGTCEQSSKYNSMSKRIAPTILLTVLAATLAVR